MVRWTLFGNNLQCKLPFYSYLFIVLFVSCQITFQITLPQDIPVVNPVIWMVLLWLGRPQADGRCLSEFS